MKEAVFTTTEGRRRFGHLVKEVEDKHTRIILTRRNKAVAVLVPYGDYQREKNHQDLIPQLENIRRKLKHLQITATEVYESSKTELTERAGAD